jgi:hypothetical protein
MAAKTKIEDLEETQSDFEYEYKKDYEDDWDIHRNYVQTFDAYEAMLIGQVWDAVSNSVDSSKITDSYAATLAKERADRVMAKLPEGLTVSVGKADVGKAAFMDILRQKWIYPNANAQHKFFEKLNLWQLYSSVYGYMPMFYDWNVSNTGYVGPDCWLWNPRNLVPQQGRVSIHDMDYVTALTWVGKKFLKNITNNDPEEEDGWNRDALSQLMDASEKSTNADSQKDSQVTRSRTPQGVKRGICLATRYEAGEDGEWITFAPDHGFIEVRRIKNPHKNGRIPFVIKYSQPLFDSFYGLGDFQRAKPLQFARDGLTNFYFKGIKMNLIPPIIANANGVMKHTLDYREGAVMLETIPNSIRRLETSTAGLATFQAAQSALTGSLLSQFGTQNASLPGSEALNPSQGKTPQAINMYSDKEATRDGAERRHLESAIEELTDGFFSLVANIGTEDIPVQLFSEDIQSIVDAGLVDVLGLFSGNFHPDQTLTAGDLTVKTSAWKGVEFRFNIETNSTMKVNKEQQLESFRNFMGDLGKFQNLFKEDSRVQIQWDEIMSTYEALSDIPGIKKFIKINQGPSPREQALQQQLQDAQQQLQDAQVKLQNKSQGTTKLIESMAYDKVPDEIKRQMEEQAGFQPAEDTTNANQPAKPELATPTIGGHKFNDPHIHGAAQELKSL